MPPRLPRYEILAELGQGGMSVVYRARDTQLPREVAVKVLHEFMARDPDARLRFHREAVAVAKLHHPGIVEIFDYSGPEAADAFIVTELIEGVTLRELIDRVGPLPLPELGALVTAALCEPLAHAHAAGVIHRDLKPENVMVTRTGELKLMDFGIAQIADGPRVTVTGTLLGSPAHMAPEVIDGGRPGVRSDLFSLGTMLYWLSTGALPFEAPNPSALFRRILEGEYADPQQAQPRMGNGLARVIRRSLERDPEARYEDARAFGEALSRELEGVGLVPMETMARALLRDPATFAESVRVPILERLTEAGKGALAEGNVARAMDRLSRVLAIAPEHAEARALVQRMGRREARARRLRIAGVATASAAVVLGVAWGAWSWVERAQAEAASAASMAANTAGDRAPREFAPGDGRAAGPSAAPGDARAASPTALPTPGDGIGGASATPPEVTPVAAETPSASPRSSAPPADAAKARGDAKATAPRPSHTRVPATPAATPRATPSPSATPVVTPTPAASPSATPSAEPVAEALVALPVRVGNSFANVYVNGNFVAKEFFVGKLQLEVGRHTLEFRSPPHGFFRKIVEVDADGSIHEIRGGGRVPLRALDLPVPRVGDAKVPPDWTFDSGAAASR